MKTSSALTRFIRKIIYRSRFTAALFFAAVMAAVFSITFGTPGTFLEHQAEKFVSCATAYIDVILDTAGAAPPFRSLITDGICAGVGSVLSFVPTIALFFLQLSILENSGVMNAAAFALDGIMGKFGLSGAAVVPMLTGFGCSVPAILSSRKIRDARQRMLLITLIPFMSCSAKLPLYIMFVSVFFPDCRLGVTTSIYAVGILTAAARSFIVKKTGFPIICDVPEKAGCDYCQQADPCNHHCSSRFCSSHTFFHRIISSVLYNTGGFIKKAFTIIFSASVIIWYLQNFDADLNMTSNAEDSILWQLGRLAAPVFSPLGFGNQHAAAALIAGFSAKEAAVSTLSIMSSAPGDPSPGDFLTSIFTPASAFSFMIFNLLCTPCIASLAVIRKETGSSVLTLCLCITRMILAWIAAFTAFSIAGCLTGLLS